MRRLGYGLAAGLAAATIVLAARGSYPLRVAELKAYDARVRALADPSRADSSIVILAIDDRSLGYVADRIGRWPWPRDVHANILEYLTYGGARLVLFDIGFHEPDLDRPELDTIFADVIEASGIATLAVAFGRDQDEDAIARFEAVLGRGEALGILGRHAVGDDAALPESLRYQMVETPPALLARGARALGSITHHPDDEDGVARRERLVYGFRGRAYASLPLAGARALEPERFGGEPVLRDDELRLGTETIPLDGGSFLVHWKGPYLRDGEPTYEIYPASWVLNSYEQVLTGYPPDVPPEAFRDKVVVVGATAAGLLDLRTTPFGAAEPGLILHATILDNLLNGDYLRRAPGWANVGMVAGAALLTGALGALAGSALVAALAALGVLALAVALATAALGHGLWLDLASPLLSGGLAFATTMAASYMSEGREKRRVRDLFSRYVPPEYVRRLADDYESLRLGGERVPVTVLFSDIRGFTSLAERLPAEIVVGMLNEYLERMAEVVFRHGGTLDKFIGDAVMAFWGAPVAVEDHARRAAAAALDMVAELEVLNRRWAEEGAPATLAIGIGVNTGEAVVGNIGSLSHKLDYTAIGDTVNLASRLEGLSKEYGCTIIISESTREGLGEGFETRVLEDAQVKGKERSVRIHELQGRARAAAPVAAKAVLPLVALLLLGGPLALEAQQPGEARARWTDRVYLPGNWSGERLVGHTTADPMTDSLALVAQVETFVHPPRWRLEIRPIEDGRTLGEPLVVVSDGRRIVILTPLGSTALEQHAAREDALVRALIARLESDGLASSVARRMADHDEAGNVLRVIVRRPAARADFDDGLFGTGTAGRLGRRLLQASMQEIGASRSQEVVATAGARGVTRVKTVDGEITVLPDTAAILRMEAVTVTVIEVDRFLREGRLGAHAVPTAQPARKEDEP